MKCKKFVSVLLTIIIVITTLNMSIAAADNAKEAWMEIDQTKVTVHTTYTSEDVPPSDLKLYVAGYRNKALIGVEVMEYTVQETFSFYFSDVTKFSIEDVDTIKVFLWDKNMKPFCFHKAVETSSTTSINNYGVVEYLSYNENSGEYDVKIANTFGQEFLCEINDENELKELLAHLELISDNFSDYNSETEYNWGIRTKSEDINKGIIIYNISKNGDFDFISGIEAENSNESTNLEYTESSSKLGGYKIDSSTKIIDLTGYLENSINPVNALTINSLVDGSLYDAYVYDKVAETHAWRFVVITNNPNLVLPSSPISIIKNYIGTTQIDDVDVCEYTVLKNGEEETLYTPASLVEGQIIMYPDTSTGWVPSDRIQSVFTPAASYEEMMLSVLSGSLVTTNISHAETKVIPYVGIAYDADLNNLELLVDFTNGVSRTADVEDLYIANANVYTYDYEIIANKGYRVEPAATSSHPAQFRPIADDDENTIIWANAEAEEVCPTIVIAREVNRDVTDVFYFTGEWDY